VGCELTLWIVCLQYQQRALVPESHTQKTFKRPLDLRPQTKSLDVVPQTKSLDSPPPAPRATLKEVFLDLGLQTKTLERGGGPGLRQTFLRGLGKLWFDFRRKAKWRRLIYTLEEWSKTVVNTAFFFRIVGVTILTIYPDWMHCKHLGTDKPFLGCLIVMGSSEWKPFSMQVFRKLFQYIWILCQTLEAPL